MSQSFPAEKVSARGLHCNSLNVLLVLNLSEIQEAPISSICFGQNFRWLWASLIAQSVKNPPAMQETPVRFLSGSSSGVGIGYPLQYSWTSLVAMLVENPPAVQQIWVRSLDWEDHLEKGKATHSSILAWRTPWTV